MRYQSWRTRSIEQAATDLLVGPRLGSSEAATMLIDRVDFAGLYFLLGLDLSTSTLIPQPGPVRPVRIAARSQPSASAQAGRSARAQRGPRWVSIVAREGFASCSGLRPVPIPAQRQGLEQSGQPGCAGVSCVAAQPGPASGASPGGVIWVVSLASMGRGPRPRGRRVAPRTPRSPASVPGPIGSSWSGPSGNDRLPAGNRDSARSIRPRRPEQSPPPSRSCVIAACGRPSAIERDPLGLVAVGPDRRSASAHEDLADAATLDLRRVEDQAEPAHVLREAAHRSAADPARQSSRRSSTQPARANWLWSYSRGCQTGALVGLLAAARDGLPHRHRGRRSGIGPVTEPTSPTARLRTPLSMLSPLRRGPYPKRAVQRNANQRPHVHLVGLDQQALGVVE